LNKTWQLLVKWASPSPLYLGPLNGNRAAAFHLHAYSFKFSNYNEANWQPTKGSTAPTLRTLFLKIFLYFFYFASIERSSPAPD